VLRGGERGAREEVLRRIKRLGLEEDVIFLPQLEYSELPLLYSSAAALIFPSLYEGAGIPVGEAMACGCPVVASDIPAVREFAGEAANYFDPEDISSILDTVKAFQRNEENRQEKIQIGLDRSRRHKPDAVVDILIDAYRQTTEQEGRHD
jgi:glycosyltransferase involved in cell wall biosynthesis